MATDESRSQLFVYGQLQPGIRFPRGAELIGPDRVHGELYDLGKYPAAVTVGRTTSSFAGYLISIPTTLLVELDEYECVEDGLYRRIEVETASGATAWIYEYLPTLPPHAIGPIESWPV
ncbi:MAG: gamma-glutamylcyclotransferase [Planctomyces sp.]|nr:gamma-glutamylcyclotransferase [Planctomyces sp.]